METFKITFRLKDDTKEETTEFMAINEEMALITFKDAEPFATIIKIEQL